MNKREQSKNKEIRFIIWLENGVKMPGTITFKSPLLNESSFLKLELNGMPQGSSDMIKSMWPHLTFKEDEQRSAGNAYEK